MWQCIWSIICMTRSLTLHCIPKVTKGKCDYGQTIWVMPSTAYCLAFFFLFISCGWSRNKVLGWKISLSRFTYLISVLPALLLLRFIDQDDCILCPLLDKSGRGKGSFAEMWFLRAGLCLWTHSQLASSLWCSVIKIIKRVKWPLYYKEIPLYSDSVRKVGLWHSWWTVLDGRIVSPKRR